MMKESALSAVILAGGGGRRFFPVEKCIAIFRGKPLIHHVASRISLVASEIIIVARDDEQGNAIRSAVSDAISSNSRRPHRTGGNIGNITTDNASITHASISHSNAEKKKRKTDEKNGKNEKIRITYDIIKDFGPLAGILSGLRESSHEFVFVTGCDMPFLNIKVVKFLLELASDFDAVVPAWEDGRIEPLHAIYRRDAMLKAAEIAVKKGERRIAAAIACLRNPKFVSVSEIRKIDNELRTFTNINTPEDLITM